MHRKLEELKHNIAQDKKDNKKPKLRDNPLSILLTLYFARHDLQQAFPEAAKDDFRRLIQWAAATCTDKSGKEKDAAQQLAKFSFWYNEYNEYLKADEMLEQKKQELAEKTMHLSELEKLAGDREKRAKELEALLKEKDRQNESLKQTLERKDAAITEKEQHSSVLSNMIAQKDSHIALIDKKILEEEGKIKNLYDTVQSKEVSISELNKVVSDRDKIVSDRDKVISDLNQQMLSLTADIKDLVQSINENKKTLDDMYAALNEKEEHVGRLERTLEQKDHAIAHLDSQLKTLQSQIPDKTKKGFFGKLRHKEKKAIAAPKESKNGIMLVCESPDLSNPIAVYDSITIEGWALSSKVGIEAVFVLIDNKEVNRAEYGLSREDVAKAYHKISNSESSGFRLNLDTSAISPGNHDLKIVAIDKNGNIDFIDGVIDVKETPVIQQD